MADDRVIQPWEQQVSESDKAFEVFRFWLFGARPRPSSCRKIEVWIGKQKNRPKGLDAVPSYRTINKWMADHDWVSRAKRYDVHLLGAEVEARVEARRDAAYDDELEQYRDRVVTSGRIIEELGRSLGVATVNWLRGETIDPVTNKPNNKAIPSGLPQAARAAEALITRGLDAQASAIGIDDILAALTRGRMATNEGDAD